MRLRLLRPATLSAMTFETVQLPEHADEIAPDGSDVRHLAHTSVVEMAHFRLAPGRISSATRHRTISEVWFVLSGRGSIWRADGAGNESVVDLFPGVSVSIPVGVSFQFRSDGPGDLDILGAEAPPWPGMDEAVLVDGPWTATD